MTWADRAIAYEAEALWNSYFADRYGSPRFTTLPRAERTAWIDQCRLRAQRLAAAADLPGDIGQIPTHYIDEDGALQPVECFNDYAMACYQIHQAEQGAAPAPASWPRAWTGLGPAVITVEVPYGGVPLELSVEITRWSTRKSHDHPGDPAEWRLLPSDCPEMTDLQPLLMKHCESLINAQVQEHCGAHAAPTTD